MTITKHIDPELKAYWGRFVGFNWRLGLFLLLVICIPRFLLVLHANTSGNYSYLAMIMIVSAIVPFLFLSRSGRKAIGIKKPGNARWLLWAVIIGFAASLAIGFLGEFLFQNTYRNWYQYIGRSYVIPGNPLSENRHVWFAMIALPGMIFSPIGEELFFRGIVHESFARSVGEKRASIIDSGAFALTHVAHFGLVFVDQQWTLLFVPGLLWVISMYTVSMLFTVCRNRSGSILGAMICHSAFNLGMAFSIFYLL